IAEYWPSGIGKDQADFAARRHADPNYLLIASPPPWRIAGQKLSCHGDNEQQAADGEDAMIVGYERVEQADVDGGSCHHEEHWYKPAADRSNLALAAMQYAIENQSRGKRSDNQKPRLQNVG